MYFRSGRETETFDGGRQKPAGMPIEPTDIENESEEQFDWLPVADDRQAVVCRPAGLDELSRSIQGNDDENITIIFVTDLKRIVTIAYLCSTDSGSLIQRNRSPNCGSRHFDEFSLSVGAHCAVDFGNQANFYFFCD